MINEEDKKPKEYSNMNNLKEDTKILVFEGVKTIEENGQIMDSPMFDEVILSKESKQKMMEGISSGIAHGYKGMVLLVPKSYLSKECKYLTYPIAFMQTPVYFIGYIRDVIVLESD